MMMANRFFKTLLISSLLIAGGCDYKPPSEKEKPVKITDGIIKKYYPDGKIKAEISIQNKKRHGVSKTYYQNGQVRQMIEYKENRKNGEARTNYESGKPHMITRYVNDKKEGVRKKYRMNGMLMSESPYVNDQPCDGLKEYLLDGTLKKRYPQIQFREENKLLLDNTFTLHVSLNEKARNVKFYIGHLDDAGCIGPETYYMKEQRPGKLAVTYEVPPGMFLMEELNFIVTFETIQGNTYFVQRGYNLAIENRGS